MFRLFPLGGTDVFTPLARFLIRPIPSIQEKFNQFKLKHFGKYTLGLQIRRIGINKLSKEQEDIFLQCAASTQIEEASTLPEEDIKWFLATDNYETRNRTVREYGSKMAIRNVPIGRGDFEGVEGI
jgi:hypothetical protein